MMEATRREVITGMGGFIAGVAVGSGGMSLLLPKEAVAQVAAAPEPAPAPALVAESVSLPWKYEKLDPNTVAERGFKGYYAHHCMYAGFESIIGELGDKLGAPYSTFPVNMMVYGAGGVAGWGSLCGALNGAAAAIQLLSPNPAELINELYKWHEETSLPNINISVAADPAEVYPASGEVTPTVAESVLCHVSVSRWATQTGNNINSAEKKQRCGQLAGSVAKKAVELLNAQADETFVAAYPLSDEVKACMGCHVGATSLRDDAQGKIDCGSCHTDLTPSHDK